MTASLMVWAEDRKERLALARRSMAGAEVCGELIVGTAFALAAFVAPNRFEHYNLLEVMALITIGGWIMAAASRKRTALDDEARGLMGVWNA